ncbi:MAG TPA: hypothetical protein VFY03_03290 [Woeseiaceae bacterium]|nr:hypothetical protein [Woeseiaceae bacterium]
MNDERLLLYYYDELDAAERRDVAAKLGRDEVLAARYRALVADLGALREAPAVRVPDGLAARLHAAVDRAATLEQGRSRGKRGGWGHGYSFFLGAAVTAALALAIGLAQREDPAAPPSPGPLTADADSGVDAGDTAAFARTMQVFFRDSRQDLALLPDAGNGERSAMIGDLIEQNRTFARLAVRNDADDLARVLRAFEPILVRLAADDITAEESEALRAKLAFELNVMLTKLTREASEFAGSTKQETST